MKSLHLGLEFIIFGSLNVKYIRTVQSNQQSIIVVHYISWLGIPLDFPNFHQSSGLFIHFLGGRKYHSKSYTT